MDKSRLFHQLSIEEGRPPATYPDSKGILSGGIGHNLIDEPEPGYDRVGVPVPDDVAMRWFEKDIQDAIQDLDRELPWWTGLDDVRQNALLNLCFNMGWMQNRQPGTGLSSFKNTLAAFEAGDYKTAANGFRNSQYAREVGPTRSGRVARMIETGEWQL